MPTYLKFQSLVRHGISDYKVEIRDTTTDQLIDESIGIPVSPISYLYNLSLDVDLDNGPYLAAYYNGQNRFLNACIFQYQFEDLVHWITPISFGTSTLPSENQGEGRLESTGTDGVVVTSHYYGTVAEAHAYFANKLHDRAWTEADASVRPKSLVAATRIIDALAFKGVRHSVYALGRNPTHQQISDANLAQPLEFPRGQDTIVPFDIRAACYEIAYALLDGKDPDQDYEDLAITSTGFSSARITYNRTQNPQEHLINGVPSPTAWRLLTPYMRDGRSLKINYV